MPYWSGRLKQIDRDLAETMRNRLTPKVSIPRQRQEEWFCLDLERC